MQKCLLRNEDTMKMECGGNEKDIKNASSGGGLVYQLVFRSSSQIFVNWASTLSKLYQFSKRIKYFKNSKKEKEKNHS